MPDGGTARTRWARARSASGGRALVASVVMVPEGYVIGAPRLASGGRDVGHRARRPVRPGSAGAAVTAGGASALDALADPEHLALHHHEHAEAQDAAEGPVRALRLAARRRTRSMSRVPPSRSAGGRTPTTPRSRAASRSRGTAPRPRARRASRSASPSPPGGRRAAATIAASTYRTSAAAGLEDLDLEAAGRVGRDDVADGERLVLGQDARPRSRPSCRAGRSCTSRRARSPSGRATARRPRAARRS